MTLTSPALPPGARPQGTRGEADAARAVREMFTRIVPRYDFLNHFLSLSQDRLWRRRTARALVPRLHSADARALDLCCGTGDLALELAQVSSASVVGADFVHAMLQRAQAKTPRAARRVAWVEADALQLPFRDASFAVVTAAFGFRNLANYERGLAEIRRVLKRGGEAAILEFALPKGGFWAALYGFYFRRLLPWVGRVISGQSDPYRYLPASVEQFPDCEEFARWLGEAGFRPVNVERWTGGTVALYRGVKS